MFDELTSGQIVLYILYFLLWLSFVGLLIAGDLGRLARKRMIKKYHPRSKTYDAEIEQMIKFFKTQPK